MSALTAGKKLPAPRASVNWAKGMPANLGMMLNDTLGDCSCAAVYHALQVWSFNAKGQLETQPDSAVEKLYEQACGYQAGKGGEGPGGNEQQVLAYVLKKGAPTGPKGKARHKIAAFVEIDPRNTDDVKRAIASSGLVYVGFKVPQYVRPSSGHPPKVWEIETKNTAIIGGHAVVLPGYNAKGASVISWGSHYKMTWNFFAKYVDEVYVMADTTWVDAKGTTPGGLTLKELEVQMKAVSET
jgi:hypothetical protein